MNCKSECEHADRMSVESVSESLFHRAVASMSVLLFGLMVGEVKRDVKWFVRCESIRSGSVCKELPSVIAVKWTDRFLLRVFTVFQKLAGFGEATFEMN